MLLICERSFPLKGINVEEKGRIGRSRRLYLKDLRWWKELKNQIRKVQEPPRHPLYFAGIISFEYDGKVFKLKKKLSDLYIEIDSYIKEKRKSEEKERVLLTAAQKVLRDNDIDFVGMSTRDMHERALDFESKRILKEKEGATLSFVNCDSCNKYVLGERRCSCGNRRVSAYVDGNLADGLYISLEAY